MPIISARRDENAEEKRIVLLEVAAASAIFSIAGVVLYMLLSYRPL